MKDAIKIVYVSTFPPRECGMATFTEDLTAAIDDLLLPAVESRVVAVNTDDISRYHYPRKVIAEIGRSSQDEYTRAAEIINAMDDVHLVNVQHEFGIFAGPFGSYIILFLQALKKPSIVTMHSVLPSPDDEMYRVVRAMAEHTSGLVAMTRRSKELLVNVYGISKEKISVIPHGIHAMPYTSSVKPNSFLGFSKKINLLTFGFLSRGKGLEYVIEALPEVVKAYPDFLYIILGVTHPNVLKEEGESYRNSLIQRVHELKLASHVNFYNEYVTLEELLQFLKAADIYIATSLNPNQAVSGTLSYALGTGRPVVSTCFAQAKELVTAEVGILVDFRDPPAYAQALITLLKGPALREQLGMNSYFRTRNMTWENVALEYLKLFSKYSDAIAQGSEHKRFPRVNLNHLFRLTDNFGIIQFAKLSLPDIPSGYTLDDNARALIAACLCYDKYKHKEELCKRIEVYLSFTEFVMGGDGQFCNYVRPDRKVDTALNAKENPEDANGRAFWALAVCAVTDTLPQRILDKARALLKKRLEHYHIFESPRSVAFHVKGFCLILEKMREFEGPDLAQLIISHCDRLVSLYRAVSSPQWEWFENYLTYSNAVLPEALILGNKHTGNSEYFDIGKKTLEFLISQTFINRIYAPIGQDGWQHKTGEHRYFDQQPEDVAAMTCALASAYTVTKDARYNKLMHEAFNWFLGDNSLKQVVYDRATGGCYDGVGEGYINLNQGAESTTSYLLARLTVAAMRVE